MRLFVKVFPCLCRSACTVHTGIGAHMIVFTDFSVLRCKCKCMGCACVPVHRVAEILFCSVLLLTWCAFCAIFRVAPFSLCLWLYSTSEIQRFSSFLAVSSARLNCHQHKNRQTIHLLWMQREKLKNQKQRYHKVPFILGLFRLPIFNSAFFSLVLFHFQSLSFYLAFIHSLSARLLARNSMCVCALIYFYFSTMI